MYYFIIYITNVGSFSEKMASCIMQNWIEIVNIQILLKKPL